MYESFYKLQGRPFQLSPDPKFFYGSPSHKRAMSYLRYGLTQGEGFIVITGDVGTGKTMLVRTLFSDLAKENVVAAQLVTTQLEAEDTLRMVAASFGLAHESLDKATILKNLEVFMTARAREGKRVLLLVDEAQNLPPRSLEELRMLSNFQLGGRILFQSFLLGQAEFRQTLANKGLEQLRQRVIAAYHLEPLDAAQTHAYIEHRLHTVGWSSDPKFTDAAYADVFQYSGGIPRRINTLCDRLLLFGSLEEVHEFDAEQVKIVVAELQHETASGGTNISTLPTETGAKLGTSASGAKTSPTGLAAPTDMEGRLSQLEQRVAALEEGLRKERARLRRAILLSDDFIGD